MKRGKFVLLAVLFCRSAQAGVFYQEVNLHSESSFLFATTNVEIATEGTVKYWKSATLGTEGSVVYKFDVGTEYQGAVSYASYQIMPEHFDPLAYLIIEASSDGVNYQAWNSYFLQTKKPNLFPRFLPIAGNTIYIRGRMFAFSDSEHIRFLPSDINPHAAFYVRSVIIVPEPNSLVLVLYIILFIFRTKK